ncbi:hypothetical protein HYDPIDRAFT_37876 [Hydnomerulius pinastri MD-312]|nr:hypothetical protein HYDPIDRAFT_37876 [Hydnomerulius pinastri MD-312]
MQFSTTLFTLLSLAALSVASGTTCAQCPNPKNPDTTYGLEDVCYMGVPDTATKDTDKAFTVCTYSCPDGAVKQCEYDDGGLLINEASSDKDFCADKADVVSTQCPAC